MKFLSICVSVVLLLGSLCVLPAAAEKTAVQTVVLSSEKNGETYTHAATVNGKAVNIYDYTWHADPSTVHDAVKNSPAEYYTGTAPAASDTVYIAHDIYYYPLLDQQKFKQVTYDGEAEWAYFYEAAGYEKYIFSTLPVQKTGFPTAMMHSAEEAYQNAVLHIKAPGTYALKGTWHGQIRIDLGEDAFDDPTQKVTLILDDVNVECTVASGIVFAQVYECDNAWEDAETHSHQVDTSNAGATVRIADGTENTVTGTNIFRILKTQYKDDDDEAAYPAQKKRLKVDGALYSYQSLNFEGGEKGDGVLNVIAGYEGMNSELHLTVNSGNVNVYSQDDGINVNEDGVSVLTVNGGSLHICAGLGAEGDGIDSNGYLVVNGGTVISAANPAADSGMDSDCGSFVNGGTVVALGATMDWAKADTATNTKQAVLNLRFANAQSADEAIILTDTNDAVVFAYDPDKDEVMGDNGRTYSGAILSSPALKVGDTYRMYVGGDLDGNEVSGVYDAATVKTFSGATRQCYGAEGVGMGGMGGGRPNRGEGDFGGMTPPEGFENGGTPPARPDGEKPQGDFGGTPPEGFGGEMPQGGFGGEMPQGGFGGEMPQMTATCGYTAEFTLTETVNAFSSVTDYRHDLQQSGEKYVCSSCGRTFDDENGNNAVWTVGGFLRTHPWVIAVLFVLAGAVLTASVFVIVLALRRKKAK